MGTTSTAQTPAAMLKRKAEAREAKIREDWRVAALDPSELRRERFEARCAEVGVDPEKDRVRARFALKAMEHRYRAVLHPDAHRRLRVLAGAAVRQGLAGGGFRRGDGGGGGGCLLHRRVCRRDGGEGHRLHRDERTEGVLQGWLERARRVHRGDVPSWGAEARRAAAWRERRSSASCASCVPCASSRTYRRSSWSSTRRWCPCRPSSRLRAGRGDVPDPGSAGHGAVPRSAFRECTVPNAGRRRGVVRRARRRVRNAPLHFDNIGQAVVAVFVIARATTGRTRCTWAWTRRARTANRRRMRAKTTRALFVLAVVVAFFFWGQPVRLSLVDNFSTVASQIGGGRRRPGGVRGRGDTYSESQTEEAPRARAGRRRAAAEKWRDENPLAMPAYRRWAFTLRNNKLWEPFMVLFITANAVQLCFYRDDAGKQETRVMSILSAVFCALYVLETFVNVVAITVAQILAERVAQAGLHRHRARRVGARRDLRRRRGQRRVRHRVPHRSLLPAVQAPEDQPRAALAGGHVPHRSARDAQHLRPDGAHDAHLRVPGVHAVRRRARALPGDGITRYANFQNWTAAISLLYVSLSGNWAEIFKDVYWECATGDLSDPSARTAGRARRAGSAPSSTSSPSWCSRCTCWRTCSSPSSSSASTTAPRWRACTTSRTRSTRSCDSTCCASSEPKCATACGWPGRCSAWRRKRGAGRWTARRFSPGTGGGQ